MTAGSHARPPLWDPTGECGGRAVSWSRAPVAGWRGSFCSTHRSRALRTLTSAAMHLPPRGRVTAVRRATRPAAARVDLSGQPRVRRLTGRGTRCAHTFAVPTFSVNDRPAAAIRARPSIVDSHALNATAPRI
jgi:hypothetical protein